MRRPAQERAASRKEAHHSAARIRRALKEVLAGRKLSVMFQPLVDAKNLSFVGAEALLGNELAGFGTVRPPDIIAAAQETPEMLIELSYQVLEAAARLCADWTAAGWDGQVSVNMPLDVLLGADAVPEIVALVRRQGIEPQKVILELTEDALYDHSNEALAALARLRLAGFGLALDDVGQRQSGLMQLANLPVTEIKIDLELMRHAREWVKPRSIIASLSALGHQLGLKVVAEGVETAEDLARARRKGVDYIQGYLISPKRPAEDIMAMLGSLPSATSSLAEVQRVTV
nr:EAL domain-containing protein [Ancylobacter koreensis]